MKDKKRLLLLIKSIDGGTGTFALQMLKLEKSFRVILCVLEKEKFRKVESLANYYFTSQNYPEYYKTGLFIPYLFLREVLWIKKIVKSENVNVILSVDTHCNLLASLFKILINQRIKLVITTHNNLSAVTLIKLSPILKPFLKYAGNLLFKTADAIVCVSQGVANDIKSNFNLKKEITVIPYGLDSSKVKKLGGKKLNTKDQKIFKDGIKIISIGRFEPQKDFFTLIKAFGRVKKEIHQAKLILIGDGYQKSELVSLVKKLKLEKSVFFLGWKENVHPYLKNSDLFVLSTKYEGFGYVILEAMSQGIPVVSTNADFGPAEVLRNGKYGKLVPVGNIDKLQITISEILTNKHELKKYAKQSGFRAKQFSERQMLENYYKLIQNL